MSEFGSPVILLILAWGGFFLIHSLLAGHTIKRCILARWPQFTPCYRLAYNVAAVITLVPVILIHISHHAKPVIEWTGLVEVIRTSLTVLALAGFFWSLKYYDLRAFTGITACRNKKPAITQDRLTISPLHRFVRHPWYLCALIIIWSRDQNSLDLISSTLVTFYFFIGAKLEEKKLAKDFGEVYFDYMRHVPGIIPLPWKYLSAAKAKAIEQQSTTPVA